MSKKDEDSYLYGRSGKHGFEHSKDVCDSLIKFMAEEGISFDSSSSEDWERAAYSAFIELGYYSRLVHDHPDLVSRHPELSYFVKVKR